MAPNPIDMNEYDFTSYLARHGIVETKKRTNGKGDTEICFNCPFGGCDDDRRPGEEWHCSMNLNTCLIHCFKCGYSGNYVELRKHYGDYEEWDSEQKAKKYPISAPKSKEQTQSNSSQEPKRKQSLETRVKKMHESTREDVREYFNGRGINNESIDKYMLSAGSFGKYHGYVIPVFDKNGKIAYVKIRKTPEEENIAKAMDGNNSGQPKYIVYPSGVKLILVGEDELVKSTSMNVLICEGELDRIIAIQEGVNMPVITAGGAQVFKDEWIDALEGRRNIYLCFDNDDAGEKAFNALAKRITECLPQASIYRIELPLDKDSHADLTDYFVTKKGTAEELFSKYAKYHCGAKPIDVSQFKEMTVADIAKVLDTTIKYDKVSKVITFLAMLLTYTESDQINVMFNASSSTGKSYISLETSKYFPPQDVNIYGKTSPTAFYYSQRLRRTDPKTNEPYIDLERRIMIFTELPDTHLQENLRSILSHDCKKVPFANTNRGGKNGKNVADEGYLLGFPSAFFCSANTNIDEQEQTRCLILSPDSTREKVMAGIDAYIDRSCHKDKFDAKLQNNPDRKSLMERILYIKSLNVKSITVDDSDYLKERFLGKLNNNYPPRIMREIHKVTSLAKAMALINVPFRMAPNKTITVTKHDIDEAIELWGEICESLAHGLPPQVFDFYKKILLPAWLKKNEDSVNPKSLTRQEIRNAYYKKMGSWPSEDTLRKNWIPLLTDTGFIQYYKKGKDEGGDGRTQYFDPLIFFGDDLEKN